MLIKKFEKFREPKKPISTYFTKRIDISKIELEDICIKMDIPFDQTKFLSAGSFGNAYKVGDDKVLKITSDPIEAKCVYGIIKAGQYNGVVNYYKILRYKSMYLILMDYVYPLDKYIKKIDDESILTYMYAITDLIFTKWSEIVSKDSLEEIIENEYDVPQSGFKRYIIGKLWDLVEKLKQNFEKSKLDIHPYNLGFSKDKDLLMFDIRDESNRQKFNDIMTIK